MKETDELQLKRGGSRRNAGRPKSGINTMAISISVPIKYKEEAREELKLVARKWAKKFKDEQKGIAQPIPAEVTIQSLSNSVLIQPNSPPKYNLKTKNGKLQLPKTTAEKPQPITYAKKSSRITDFMEQRRSAKNGANTKKK